VNYKQLAKGAQALLSQGAPKLADRVMEAATKAGQSKGSELIDTTRLREKFGKVTQSIRDSMPKPEDVKKAVSTDSKVMSSNAPTMAKPVVSTLAPIVTSLGKVGGGGYSSGVLDAQRENNRLTAESNRLLLKIAGAKPAPVAAAFG
jgi:hypothetical protein